ncbi:hypothetical protein BGZ57DRAFT_909607 [Hyaloscypha finlandica]|nr:hypothetical protein BGZ57DRAFT_909607 [Hyaloscypha finlandica]
MDRFTGMLAAVDCHAESMMLQFNSNASFTSARNSWNWVSDAVNNTFVLIANYEGCGPDQERQPFLVNDLTFIEANFTVFLDAQQKEWEDVAKTYSFNMGYSPPLNSSVLARRDDPDFVMSLESNFNRNLFSTEVNGIELSVDCVNCGTSGRLNVEFDMDVNVFSDSHLAMKISPQDVAAFLQIALSAKGTLSKEYSWEKTLISIPIEGVKVDSFAKIGAFLDVDVGFTIDEWAGEVDATFGARMGLSNNAIVEIDVLHLGSGKFSGWDPALTAIPFTLSAKVEGGVTLYAQPSISLSAEAFSKGIELSLDLRMPYIEADFTAMADSGGMSMQTRELTSQCKSLRPATKRTPYGSSNSSIIRGHFSRNASRLGRRMLIQGPRLCLSRQRSRRRRRSLQRLRPRLRKCRRLLLDASSTHKPSKTKSGDGTPTPKPKPSSSDSKPTKEPPSSSGVKSPADADRSTASKSGSKSSTGTGSSSSEAGASKASSTSGTKSNTNGDTSLDAKTGTDTKTSSSSTSDSKLTETGTGTGTKPGTTIADSKTSSTTDTNTKSGTSSSSPSLTSSSAAAACKLPKRAGNNGDFYCDENGHTHTTITTATVSILTTPEVTCSSKWTQACYHYRSVMSVHSDKSDMVRFTCGATSSSAPGKATKVWSTTVSRNNVATTPKGNQHHWQWIEGWVSAGKGVCQRDEWPPRSFWPVEKRNQLGQLVRFLPGAENEGAGSMFNSFCERNGPRAADGKKNAKFHTTMAS